jgi:hypothetical protein
MRKFHPALFAGLAFAGLASAGLAGEEGTKPATDAATPAKIPVVVTPAAPSAPTPAAAPTGPTGTLEIKETTWDAGTIERGAALSHSFLLKNIGKGDLTVDAKAG